MHAAGACGRVLEKSGFVFVMRSRGDPGHRLIAVKGSFQFFLLRGDLHKHQHFTAL